MPPTPIYPLVDRALGGRLAELLDGWKAESKSVFQITMALRDEHDIAVSPDTVRRWLKSENVA